MTRLYGSSLRYASSFFNGHDSDEYFIDDVDELDDFSDDEG